MLLALALGVSSGFWGCGSDDGALLAPGSLGRVESESSDAPAAALPEAALDATWQQLGVAGASILPALASTPTGYFALSRRTLGTDSKLPSGYESYLFRSVDGIRWRRVAVSANNDDVWLRGVAYGGGHYVLAGNRVPDSDAVFFHSKDGERWSEIHVDLGSPNRIAAVVYAGSRFFALSAYRTLLTSPDGTTWSSIELGSTVMPTAVTYGKGQYLLVGSGDVQRSANGVSWTATPLDCAMPGACLATPDGTITQSVHFNAVFAGDTFFIDQASSSDGRSWQSLPGVYAVAAVDERVLGSTPTDALAIWMPNQSPHPLATAKYADTLSEPDRVARMLWNAGIDQVEDDGTTLPNDMPVPEQLEFPLPDGADCTTAPCIVVDNRLYLIQTRGG